MKHNPKIIAILLLMFIIAQFIGLYVVNSNVFTIEQEVNGTIKQVPNPSLDWINPRPESVDYDYNTYFISILMAFVIAITLLFTFTKLNWQIVLRAWFFLVVVIALGITLLALFPSLRQITVWAFVIALPFAFLKIYKREIITHNLTELFIYPGIAAVFVPILSLLAIIVLLILISIYDMWAVWKSGIMQKMAKYQMTQLKVFSGFLIPYLSKKQMQQLVKAKKSKSKKKKKISVGMALLGGGDVVFPIITAGVVLMALGPIHALFVVAGATLGLGYLFLRSEKKKFYPAMPFITVGMFIGLGIAYLLL